MHQDRPSPATWATFALIKKLVKQGTMDQTQVIQILRICSRIDKSSAAVDADAARSQCSLPGDVAPALRDFEHDTDIRSICRSVLLRLAVLRDRISEAGEAVLPPSCAIMGPPFVPALDFLHSLVLGAAALSPSAGTAIGAASTAEDAEMEAYATAAGGGSRDTDAVEHKRIRTGP
jgi:hypothetical protein